jgi:regulator of sigma E protease
MVWQANDGQPIGLTVRRIQRESNSYKTITLTTQITPRPEPLVNLGIMLKPKMVRQKYPITGAITAGVSETIDMVRLTLQLVWKLVAREESPKGLAGPIGIIHASYYIVQEGIPKFLWLLALLSVSLAIFNLFPIPILDGGGMLFTLIEAILTKIKKKPTSISIKVIAISQYIGLALLLTLVVYATYNDIFRALGLH